MSTKVKINYAAFLNSSGYSQAAQNYILALHKTNQFDIKLRIFGDKPAKPAVSDEKYEIFRKMAKKEEDPERILIYHCIPNIQRRVKKHNKKIGFATFETFQPPDSWIDILNHNDAIITPSKFNNRIFSNADVKKPLFYIPHCINTEVYNKDVIKLNEYDKYTFLFMGIWRERKGYKQLLEAWFREFDDTDGVQLIIKTDKPKKAFEYLDSLRKQMGIDRGFASIKFENKIFDEKILPKFIKSMDCLIAPTMGEGFCMTPESPVICRDGYRDISSLKEGEMVYTHRGRFRSISKVMSRHYVGDILHINVLKGWRDQAVTPEHPVLVVKRGSVLTTKKGNSRLDKSKLNYDNAEWIRASDVEKNDFLLFPTQKEYDEVDYNLDIRSFIKKVSIREENGKIQCAYRNGNKFWFNNKLKLNPELMWLFGIYIAEGCSNEEGIYFTFHSKEREYYNKVVELFKKYFDKKCKLDFIDNKVVVRVYSRILAELFGNLCGRVSHEKKISYFMDYKWDMLQYLLYGIFDGDGHSEKKRILVELQVVSDKLLQQLYIILMRNGISTSLQKSNRNYYRLKVFGETIDRFGWRNVVWAGNRRCSRIKVDDDYHYIPVTDIQKYQYNGLVYNLEVDEDNTYVSQTVVHNCYPGLQCMALMVPVIITNFSGPQDYANSDTATLLEPSGFVVRNNMDNIPQFRNKKWAFIEVARIQRAMRYVINNRDEIRMKANVAYSYVRRRFAHEEIGKMFIKMVRELYG